MQLPPLSHSGCWLLSTSRILAQATRGFSAAPSTGCWRRPPEGFLCSVNTDHFTVLEILSFLSSLTQSCLSPVSLPALLSMPFSSPQFPPLLTSSMSLSRLWGRTPCFSSSSCRLIHTVILITRCLGCFQI